MLNLLKAVIFIALTVNELDANRSESAPQSTHSSSAVSDRLFNAVEDSIQTLLKSEYVQTVLLKGDASNKKAINRRHIWDRLVEKSLVTRVLPEVLNHTDLTDNEREFLKKYLKTYVKSWTEMEKQFKERNGIVDNAIAGNDLPKYVTEYDSIANDRPIVLLYKLLAGVHGMKRVLDYLATKQLIKSEALLEAFNKQLYNINDIHDSIQRLFDARAQNLSRAETDKLIEDFKNFNEDLMEYFMVPLAKKATEAPTTTSSATIPITITPLHTTHSADTTISPDVNKKSCKKNGTAETETTTHVGIASTLAEQTTTAASIATDGTDNKTKSCKKNGTAGVDEHQNTTATPITTSSDEKRKGCKKNGTAEVETTTHEGIASAIADHTSTAVPITAPDETNSSADAKRKGCKKNGTAVDETTSHEGIASTIAAFTTTSASILTDSAENKTKGCKKNGTTDATEAQIVTLVPIITDSAENKTKGCKKNGTADANEPQIMTFAPIITDSAENKTKGCKKNGTSDANEPQIVTLVPIITDSAENKIKGCKKNGTAEVETTTHEGIASAIAAHTNTAAPITAPDETNSSADAKRKGCKKNGTADANEAQITYVFPIITDSAENKTKGCKKNGTAGADDIQTTTATPDIDSADNKTKGYKKNGTAVTETHEGIASTIATITTTSASIIIYNVDNKTKGCKKNGTAGADETQTTTAGTIITPYDEIKKSCKKNGTAEEETTTHVGIASTIAAHTSTAAPITTQNEVDNSADRLYKKGCKKNGTEPDIQSTTTGPHTTPISI